MYMQWEYLGGGGEGKLHIVIYLLVCRSQTLALNNHNFITASYDLNYDTPSRSMDTSMAKIGFIRAANTQWVHHYCQGDRQRVP